MDENLYSWVVHFIMLSAVYLTFLLGQFDERFGLWNYLFWQTYASGPQFLI